MSEYHFTLNGDGMVALSRDDDFVFLEGVDGSVHFIEEQTENMVNHAPTDGFWESLIELNQISADLLSHKQSYPVHVEPFTPDVSDCKVPSMPSLPKYEERIAQEFYSTIMHYRKETNTVYQEYPSLRKLLSAAYDELHKGIEKPYYLHDPEEDQKT